MASRQEGKLGNTAEIPRGPRSLRLDTAAFPSSSHPEHRKSDQSSMLQHGSQNTEDRRSQTDRNNRFSSQPTGGSYRPRYERPSNHLIPSSKAFEVKSSSATVTTCAAKAADPKTFASTEPSAFSSDSNGQPSVRKGNPDTLTQTQADGNSSLKVKLLSDLNNWAASIKVSTGSDVKAGEYRQEAEIRTKFCQRQLKHRETFPHLFEEAEFRASKITQLSQEAKSKADLAQKIQESATSALALTLQQIHPIKAQASVDNTTLASLWTEIWAMRERESKIETELQTTREYLESARTEINDIKCNALTETVLEARLHQHTRDMLDSEAHKAADAKIRSLVHDLTDCKAELGTVRELVASFRKQWSDLVKENKENISSVRDIMSSLTDLISTSGLPFKEAVGALTDQKHMMEKEFENFRNTVLKVKDIQEIESTARTVDMSLQSDLPRNELSNQAYASMNDVAKLEKSVATGNEEGIKILREEQSITAETLMQEMQDLEDGMKLHDKDLRTIEETVANISRSRLQDQDRSPTDISPGQKGLPLVSGNDQVRPNPASHQYAGAFQNSDQTVNCGQRPENAPFQQSDSASQHSVPNLSNNKEVAKNPSNQFVPNGSNSELIPNPVKIPQHETELAKLKMHIQYIERISINHQQTLDELSCAQFTENIINTIDSIVRMHPMLSGNTIKRMDQIAHEYNVLAETVAQLSEQYNSLDAKVKDKFNKELRPISNRNKELESSLNAQREIQMARDIVLKEDIACHTTQYRKLSSTLEGLNSKIERIESRGSVSFSSPSKLDFRRPSMSLGISLQAEGPDVGSPPQKRRRFSSPDSSDVPLAIQATAKREKQIRRMSKSKGGLP